jgi:hypothetical protein
MRSAQFARRRKTPLQQVSERLESDDESAWYAERLEILGKVMFGDLWKGVHCESEDSPQSREVSKV